MKAFRSKDTGGSHTLGLQCWISEGPSGGQVYWQLKVLLRLSKVKAAEWRHD